MRGWITACNSPSTRRSARGAIASWPRRNVACKRSCVLRGAAATLALALFSALSLASTLALSLAMFLALAFAFAFALASTLASTVVLVSDLVEVLAGDSATRAG